MSLTGPASRGEECVARPSITRGRRARPDRGGPVKPQRRGPLARDTPSPRPGAIAVGQPNLTDRRPRGARPGLETSRRLGVTMAYARRCFVKCSATWSHAPRRPARPGSSPWRVRTTGDIGDFRRRAGPAAPVAQRGGEQFGDRAELGSGGHAALRHHITGAARPRAERTLPAGVAARAEPRSSRRARATEGPEPPKATSVRGGSRPAAITGAVRAPRDSATLPSRRAE